MDKILQYFYKNGWVNMTGILGMDMVIGVFKDHTKAQFLHNTKTTTVLIIGTEQIGIANIANDTPVLTLDLADWKVAVLAAGALKEVVDGKNS